MRRLIALTASVLGALALLPASGCSAQETAGDKAFGAKVRAYILAHPEVLQEAMARLQAKDDAAAAGVARAAIVAHRAELRGGGGDPVGGDPAGKVVVTEFFDYRCPYCKASAPELPALLKRHPDVRFVYKEFPILSPESEQASRLALAAAKQGRYEAVHQGLMRAPRLDDTILDAVLTQAGVDVAKARADAQTPAVTAQIAKVHALAQAVGVNGTPAFVIGDRIENGWSAATIEADLAAAGSKPVG